MPVAGPGRQQQKEPCALATRDGVPLVRFEVEERSGVAVDRVASGVDAHRPLKHEEERRLFYAVVAERLTGPKDDEDRALGAFLRMEHDG